MDHQQSKIIEKSLILRIWGKTRPYHPLLFHLIDTGNVAYALLDAKSFHFQLQLLSEVSSCPENI